VPTQMNPVLVSQSEENCNQTRISWNGMNSCDTLDKNEVQCIGADGIYSSMTEKTNAGSSTELIMDTTAFQKTPFML